MSIRNDTIKGSFEINDAEREHGFRHLLETLDIEDRDGFMEILTQRAQQNCPANVSVQVVLAAMIDAFVAGVRSDQLTMIEVLSLHTLKKIH